ncbi:MAG TPA: lipopolysaccharide transport periplasmic protein LptA [Persephonella sp.]|uniref:Lipopolysaccharide transport periplasmic protein LptA n=1 Tax=Persephonella marina (strain DSM 14350 / EX-H1) TaxID=123214 RepID=C0QS42_PERMH|nr:MULTISPECIES: lipopolysaccharide transport periplasmic protein LptA [Persephonella]ACO04780.1 lipopolysaccharide transport periplasmic protein LptA [Persephonella marina EX-H1]HCB69233.1 lipopolysaccharide transport periplasmic protein LptA [Persephonella sp.]
MVRLILIFFMLFSFAYPQEEKKEEPILIEADELVYNKNENTAVYKGNVTVKKGNLTINAEKMIIYLSEEGDISRIYAEGDVRFKKGNRSGSSKKAEYIKDKDIIVLIDKAKLIQEKNIIEGDEIIYHLDTEVAEVKGKDNKVRTVIFPDKIKEKEK